MNEKLRAILEASGQLAELTKIQHDAFLNAGFTAEQALYLAGDFMAALITTTGRDEDE